MRETADTLSILQSGTVARQVKNSLHLSESAADLQGRLSASVDPNTDLITISVTDPSPTFAAKLANGFANSLVNYLTQAQQAQIAAGQAQISRQIAQLPATNSSARTVLEQALKQVTALRAVTNGNVQIVDPAQPPTSPSSPNVKRDAVVGGLVGIILGLAVAFLIDLGDRRVKTVTDLEQLYGLPALTTIPLRKRTPTTQRELQLDLEPFRILRDGLSFTALRDNPRVVLITSAAPGEGKTRVAVGLARAVAITGSRVVLVEADLHRPMVVRTLRLEAGGRGLTNALVGGADLSKLIRPVPGVPGLSVLSSGPLTLNVAELLRSASMGIVLSELAAEYDYVILDGPPIVPVTDAQVLMDSARLDVCVVVARPYVTTRDYVARAVAVLKRHPGIATCLAVNGVRELKKHYYYRASEDIMPPKTKPPSDQLAGRTTSDG